MSFRQDKLILLLDTGSNPQVRRTAGKQIADLAGKTFRASVEPKQEVKVEAEPEAISEDVKPDVEEKPELAESKEAPKDERVTVDGAVSEEDAWSEVLDTVAKILPLLKAKGSDTRQAAAHTLGLLAGTLPGWTLPLAPWEATPPVHLPTLLRDEAPLLASAGREYAAKPMGGDKAKRRQAMMGSLGLGDAVGWGEDVDKVIGDEEDDVDMAPKANGKGAPSPKPSAPPKDIFEGLSARQVAMLKRKKGNIEEEANKMRKLNAAATGASAPAGVSPSPSNTPTPAPSPSPAKLESSNSSENVVTIDPGAKARAAAASGGAVEPTDAPVSAIPKISVAKGQSPWQATLLEILPNLSAAEWQARHGANLALLEIVRSTYFADDFLLHIARSLLALLALDRFGDFVGDTVIAPVRETAAQALGVVLKRLSLDGAREVHAGLMAMVLQSWTMRGREADGLQKYEKFAWEVRHAGLLGLKYEVAVRTDLLEHMVVGKTDMEVDEKPDVKVSGVTFLQDVVNAASLAMRDQDDDVRTVAATALLPITGQLASQLSHDELSSVLDTLWDCLAEGGDELGSSTGAIMDLLGALIAYPEVMRIMAEDSRSAGERSRLALISRIYPFIRHPIQTVRLSVAKALHTFATVPSLPRVDWILEPFFQLLFQNLVLEQNPEIRKLSFAAFQAALEDSAESGAINDVVSPNVEEWYKMVMTPVGSPLDSELFFRAAKTGGYNVDKPMMEGDLGLVSTNTVLETRIVVAKALALLRRYQPESSDVSLLKSYLSSGTAHQVFAAAVIIQEWAFDVDARNPSSGPLPASNPAAQEFAEMLVKKIESPPPATYAEMTLILTRIASECQALLSAFSIEGKVSKDRVPSVPKRVDPLSTSADVFSLASAQNVVGPTFDALTRLLTKNATKTVLPSLEDRRRKVIGSIGYFSVMKERYDIQVDSAIAGSLIALRTMPGKFGPVIKAVMESVKREENVVLQERSAELVSAFVEFCGGPHFTGKVNPCPKVVKNLWTFLCSDTAVTPIFTPTGAEDGIVSLKEEKAAAEAKPTKKGQEAPTETEEQIARRTTRLGALAAFKAMARRFEGRLFDSVPAFWDGISAALIASYPTGTTSADEVWAENTTAGQDMVDCLTSLRLVAPELHPSLHPRLTSLLPQVVLALQSSYSMIRYTAAKCLAALCDVVLDEGMKFVVDEVVPLIGDAKRISARQGATEAIYHIIKLLDIKALPYVLFLIVPILGRTSDPDDQVRLLSTSTFASLVKMVPLEAGIPDPPGFSPELLARRDEERKFLMQLLDGSKAEQYQVPIPIKADLRQYQRDGVSWLAFLAKYQLHGILCDDMGLGKSLQSICIIGSKHFERAEKHRQTSSVDSAHLPSLIVCPPTLTGHWYYEILKFTDYLKPIQYVGSSFERPALRSQLSQHDVVIASYETVRADIAELSKIDWLYCVLDEGHIIKNAKTKLSAAVKLLRAQHRLLLSGTPIQNNVLELWSLFDFLMPGFLGNERAFNDKFSKPILADRDGKATPKEREAAAVALEALHKQVLPFLLRRLKEDVLNDLPPKIIQDYYCELSPVQKHLYDEFAKSKAAEEAGEEVEAESSSAGQGHVFQSLQYLRKLCNHPALVLQGEEQRFEEIRKKIGGETGGIHDIRHSPKLMALQQLLLDCGIGLPASEKAGAGGEEYNQHRVLIFCQLRPMLDLIETDLFKSAMPSVSYMRMDGSSDPRKRHAVVQTFNNDPRIDVLLLTTSVGGLGLNLTGADTVIFVDHDWNPMKDLQAMDRAHRLGQKKVVNVYRLITRGTLEEKIMGLQRFKLNIASSVVTQQNAGLGSMNTGEVLDLFKVSAEGGPPKAVKAPTGPSSASKILEGLEDLPPEDEYAELSLSNFMSKV